MFARCESAGTERNRVTFSARLQLGSSFAGLQIPYAQREAQVAADLQIERHNLETPTRNKRVVVICDEQQLLAVANNEIIGAL
jgi:hypothetical protein